MTDQKRLARLKILNTATFLMMLAVNALANSLPLNGLSTGAVANFYPNLFTPTAITFSIWGLIYLLLSAFIWFCPLSVWHIW